jgi:hypothetical protein
MSEVYNALATFPKRPEKKHFVTIQGTKIEVSLQKKLEIMKHGEQNYIMKEGDIVIKAPPKAKTQYSVLKKSKKGYRFCESDIHWPVDVMEGGEAWVIEHE